MSVEVYGSSDDLIEVEGGINEEFTAADSAKDYLAFSDGTVISIEYTSDGIWRIAPLAGKRDNLRIEQALAGDEDNYTDRAFIEGDIDWVVQGREIAMLPKARV